MIQSCQSSSRIALNHQIDAPALRHRQDAEKPRSLRSHRPSPPSHRHPPVGGGSVVPTGCTSPMEHECVSGEAIAMAPLRFLHLIDDAPRHGRGLGGPSAAAAAAGSRGVVTRMRGALRAATAGRSPLG
jgi:hypothetical protein